LEAIVTARNVANFKSDLMKKADMEEMVTPIWEEGVVVAWLFRDAVLKWPTTTKVQLPQEHLKDFQRCETSLNKLKNYLGSIQALNLIVNVFPGKKRAAKAAQNRVCALRPLHFYLLAC